MDGWHPGAIIGNRYRLKHLFAESGASSFVFLAEDTTLQTRVAIKALRPEYAASQEHVERFLRESRLLAAARSPHIIKILDRGSYSGVHWYAMEYYARSETLDQFIAKFVDSSGSCGRVPVAIAHKIAVDLMRALYAIHPDAHRDVKPSNILITRVNDASASWSEDPEDYHLVLLDFGIAKGERDKTLTSTGQACGTDGYMAPEAFSDGISDHRVDLYAWAVILAEALAGGRLARGFNVKDLRSFRPANEVNPWIPVLERQLSRDPDERADARDVLSVLESIKPRSSSAAAVKQRRPIRRWAIAAVALLGSISAASYHILNSRDSDTPVKDSAASVVDDDARADFVMSMETQLFNDKVVYTPTEETEKQPPKPKKKKPRSEKSKTGDNKQKMKVYDAFGYQIHLPEDEPLRIHVE